MLSKYIDPMLSHVPIFFTPIGSIGAMFSLVYLSKLQHAVYSFLFTFRYDLVNASYRYGSKSKRWNDQIEQRAYNAHANNWEAFIGYSVAVILIIQSKIKSIEIDQLCNLFILVRIAFTIIYPLAFAVPLSMLRSSIFVLGLGIIVKLFVIAIPTLSETSV